MNDDEKKALSNYTFVNFNRFSVKNILVITNISSDFLLITNHSNVIHSFSVKLIHLQIAYFLEHYKMIIFIYEQMISIVNLDSCQQD